jgi:putative membrane protein
MAVLFLILQLSSSGAIVPIQLSGEVFQFLHPYLPFTWVVKATKVAMFDAYDGQWLAMYAQMLITPLILWPLSTYTGRWIYQAEADYMPALDVVQ